MYRTRIDGTRIDVRVRSKGLTVIRRSATLKHILYEETLEPAGSAAGSHLASEVGGRPPGSRNRTRALARARNAWTRHGRVPGHPRLTIWYGWCRSDGRPFSSGRLARARCSRSGSRSLSRLLASARVRPGSVSTRSGSGSTLAFPRVRIRPGRTPGSDQARHPRQQRSLGSERGLATPSPDGKGEIPLGPSAKIMPVDSYSTLGRSCEPAFKWIRQARPRLGPGLGPAAVPGPVPGAGCAAVSGARWWLVRAGRPRGELLVHLTGKLTRGPAG
jgi:hypothetical protein